MFQMDNSQDFTVIWTIMSVLIICIYQATKQSFSTCHAQVVHLPFLNTLLRSIFLTMAASWCTVAWTRLSSACRASPTPMAVQCCASNTRRPSCLPDWPMEKWLCTTDRLEVSDCNQIIQYVPSACNVCTLYQLWQTNHAVDTEQSCQIYFNIEEKVSLPQEKQNLALQTSWTEHHRGIVFQRASGILSPAGWWLWVLHPSLRSSPWKTVCGPAVPTESASYRNLASRCRWAGLALALHKHKVLAMKCRLLNLDLYSLSLYRIRFMNENVLTVQQIMLKCKHAVHKRTTLPQEKQYPSYFGDQFIF